MYKEIRLSGSGGQGLITAGIILARAATLYDNNHAVQTQSYGPEARGGASKSEVIVSDSVINFPKVQSPDVLVALTQEALSKYINGVGKDTLIIVDDLLVKELPAGYTNVNKYPIIMSASNELQAPMTANIITLGILNSLCKVVSEEALQKAVVGMFPAKATELNMKALSLGVKMVSDVQ